MRLALIASNMVRISKQTRKGSEIFVYIFIKSLLRSLKKKRYKVNTTLFASGDSSVPIKLESVHHTASVDDKYIGIEHHKLFEMPLLSKAFSMQSQFDLYHSMIGNGEWILPFSRFTKKPIIVTMHGEITPYFFRLYYPIFKDLKNVHFVSISDSQRKPYPNLNYIKTIYHGIDTTNSFTFNEHGGEWIMWAGRGIPEKGPDTALSVAKRVRKNTKLFPIIKEDYLTWLQKEVLSRSSVRSQKFDVLMEFNLFRNELIPHYQHAKLFLFPVQLEEPFGLVMIESMACGTPVVAYARGSIPEIIKDGVTGFIVNPSDDDIRGDWVIKKTGIEGLVEAVKRIYSLKSDEYRQMRKNCREHAEKHFTVERMTNEYLDLYKKLM